MEVYVTASFSITLLSHAFRRVAFRRVVGGCRGGGGAGCAPLLGATAFPANGGRGGSRQGRYGRCPRCRGRWPSVVYPSLLQMVFEEIEKKKALPASPNTGDELHKMVAFALDEFVNNVFSFNCHREPTFCLCVFTRKLKPPESYHAEPQL